jgi:bacterial/archaeal transporter family protein
VTEPRRLTAIPLWLAYCLAAVVIFGLWGIFSTAASQQLTPWQVQVFSTVGMLPVAVAACFLPGFLPARNLPRGLFWAFCTGLANAVANIALFAALGMGAEASVIFPLTGMFPVVTIIIARFVLAERLTGAQLAGVVLTLIAILLFSMVEPTPQDSTADHAEDGAAATAETVMSLDKPPLPQRAWWLGLAGICLLGWGISGVTQKVATRYISESMSIVGFIAANLPIAVAIAVVQRIDWSVGWTAWGWSLAIGLSIGVSTLLLFASFAAGGKAGIVTALGALYPAITVVLAVPMFGDRISMLKGAGIVVALAAGVLLSRERTDNVAVVAVPADGLS